MRSVHLFNQHWLYAPRELARTAPDSDFDSGVVHLPHTNVLLPHHNFDNAEYQFISTYRKRFTLPEPLNGRRLFIQFDGAMMSAQVWLNDHLLGEHDGGFVPFEFDITEHVREGENVLHVRLDSTERPDIPPYGYVVDYLTFGGIYRDVWLRYVEPVYIEDVFVRTLDVLTAPRVEVDVTVVNASGRDRNITMWFGLSGLPEILGDASQEAKIITGTTQTITVPIAVNNVRLWSLADPVQYQLKIVLDDADTYNPLDEGEPVDEIREFIGFREAVFRNDGFYLNGEKIKLRGLNRHQTYPYIGAAAPARLQRKDADIIKYELGCNIVRTSHYPQSPHFLQRCDEIGLLVLEEIPGWQFIGDRDWQALSLRDVQAMIMRDRNHPSIVLWGVRINESPDDDAFYQATNDLAHELDPTRQTGGIRNFQFSHFLEDVFTYNDFSNTVEPPPHTPHLVTEFGGHMFPTKTVDNEERQIDHALLHARVQNQSAGMDDVTGAIGWCAFDYNTHREFGAGDRICYHGVMDIFRLPKYAAGVYESQIDPAVRPVLRAATSWAFGEQSTTGVNPLVIFTNCDTVEIFKGEDREGRFKPDRAQFAHLPHPPIIVTDFTGMYLFGHQYQDLRLVGYVGEQAVTELRLSSAGVPHTLELRADDTEIDADGSDMTRVTVRVTDRYGNRLPYNTVVVGFECEGEGELIGENPFALVGGQAAVYIKARTTPGTVRLRAQVLNPYSARLRPAEVTVQTV